MVNNQLFRKTPPRGICLKILNAFGLKDFTDTRNFSRKDLEVIKCLDQINEFKDELQEYYIPCKSRTYLNELNTKNVITILRQIVRLHNYSVVSREKYIKGDKFMIYQLVPSETRNYQPVTISTNSDNNGNDYVIKFD